MTNNNNEKKKNAGFWVQYSEVGSQIFLSVSNHFVTIETK